jgi:hypothetical protein
MATAQPSDMAMRVDGYTRGSTSGGAEPEPAQGAPGVFRHAAFRPVPSDSANTPGYGLSPTPVANSRPRLMPLEASGGVGPPSLDANPLRNASIASLEV